MFYLKIPSLFYFTIAYAYAQKYIDIPSNIKLNTEIVSHIYIYIYIYIYIHISFFFLLYVIYID